MAGRLARHCPCGVGALARLEVDARHRRQLTARADADDDERLARLRPEERGDCGKQVAWTLQQTCHQHTVMRLRTLGFASDAELWMGSS